MALAADFHADALFGSPCMDDVTACAGNGRQFITRMNVGFHFFNPLISWLMVDSYLQMITIDYLLSPINQIRRK